MENEQSAPPRLHCVNAYDFLSMSFPAREMLLSPILPRQGLCMLHAMRGIGKTFISLSVAYAVASGGKVFDRWGAPQPARVLFIDGEMPARTLQERLVSLVAGSNLEPPSHDYLRILTPDMQDGPMPNLATREGQEAVAPLLKGVDLVVVDNLATLARHGRSNDEESWVNSAETLVSPAKKYHWRGSPPHRTFETPEEPVLLFPQGSGVLH